MTPTEALGRRAGTARTKAGRRWNVYAHVPVEATRRALHDLAEGGAGDPDGGVGERPARGAG